jgi:hypothetical protein
MPGIELLISDAAGVYIPQEFATSSKTDLLRGVNPEDLAILAKGPGTDAYWEAWDEVLMYFSYTDPEGHVWTLEQDGDLWLICPDLMTSEERDEEE